MIPVEVSQVINIISHTPGVIQELVGGLDENWIHANEGPDTWSPHEVVAHLVYGEKTDWIPRMQIMLSDREDKTFIPFDRAGHFPFATKSSTESLLHQFAQLRKENIYILSSAELTSADLQKQGTHPELGLVTLGQLLAAWVSHDMSHIYQISRTIAKQYEVEVGPWKAFMGIYGRR